MFAVCVYFSYVDVAVFVLSARLFYVPESFVRPHVLRKSVLAAVEKNGVCRLDTARLGRDG